MSIRRRVKASLATASFIVVLVIGQSCGSKSPPENQAETSDPETVQADPATDAPPSAEIDPTLLERLRNEKWTGDLDGMIERRYIRALVLYSKTGFFYDGPQPRGISYEALREFEKFLNKNLNTGSKPVQIVFMPVTREEGLKTPCRRSR